jgi:hypothetical protein
VELPRLGNARTGSRPTSFVMQRESVRSDFFLTGRSSRCSRRAFI